MIKEIQNITGDLSAMFGHDCKIEIIIHGNSQTANKFNMVVQDYIKQSGTFVMDCPDIEECRITSFEFPMGHSIKIKE